MASATATRGRKTQEAGAPTPASAIYLNSNDTEYTLNSYRVQRLISVTGMSPTLAAVSSPFIFGGAA